MEHSTTKNDPKIVEECTYPLTSKNCVNLIVTDVAILEVKYYSDINAKLVLREAAPQWKIEDIQKITNAEIFEK